MVLRSVIDVATIKPALEVADIFRLHFDDYLQTHHCTAEEFAAVKAIIQCRTAALGGHIRVCDGCGKFQIGYNSCNNRNCPKCGAFEKAQWLAKQAARLLPVPHFHGVFTLDHLVNPLAAVGCPLGAEAIYDLLFQTANRVLKQFAVKYLGGQVAPRGHPTAVLHTWGQTLQHHIHLHCMITGGALVETEGGYEWRASAPGFLLPVVELSAAFRDAFCKGLRKLHKQGELRLVGECVAPERQPDVEQLVAQMQAKKWEVYLGAPPAKVEDLLGYFSRYIHRTAISNRRIVKLEGGQVTFAYYDNKERDAAPSGHPQGKPKVMTLPAVEFIRRFLQHVLPFQYKRAQGAPGHFGLYASSNKLWRGCPLGAVRLLVGQRFEQPEAPKLQLGEWLQSLGIADAFRCPFCDEGTMRLGREFAPIRGFALWLLTLLGLPVFGQEAAT